MCKHVETRAVIVAYGRSAVAKGGKGTLRATHPADFAAQVLNGVMQKVPALRPEQIDDLIVGCAKPESVQTSNLARIVAQRAQLPDAVPGQTVNRFCASGLQAIASGANAIAAGQAEIVVAGGVESMSLVPMGVPEAHRNAWLEENRPGVYLPMGLTAENVAEQYGISREEMDEMAMQSHRKAHLAQSKGQFSREIIPVSVKDGESGGETLLMNDEGIRPNTSMEKLAGLEPCFKPDGLVTAATSSQVSDGAAFVVLMSPRKAAELNLKPIARFCSYAVAGVAPEIMGIGPMEVVPKALALANITVGDLEVVEINEAFAAQAIPCIQEIGLDAAKVNPRGGAIALGHPLGASGAILTCKALSYLEDNGGAYALVTMCIGGGMGAAGVFEKL